MDFGTILDKWEKKSTSEYPVKDIEEKPAVDIKNLKNLKPQAVLDLHGSASLEAEEKIEEFLSGAASKGLIKVLIIHGKGNHSRAEPVLKKTTMEILRKSPYAGLTGIPDRKMGGSGAVWVLVKKIS